MRKRLSSLDHSLSGWLQDRPKSLRYFYGWITLIGHPVVVLFIACAGFVFSLGLGVSSLAKAFIAVVVAYGLSTVLKLVLRRPRPKTPYAAGMFHKSFSFPSGHAFGSLIVYGLFAAIAFRYLDAIWAIIAGWGLWSIIFVIGISRIYLGAHFVLDVVGGWLLSAPILIWVINTFLY